MTAPGRGLTLSLLLWSVGGPLPAQDAHILRLEGDPNDSVYDLVTRVRHTTVITLPAGENILDFVVGDPEYWALSGSANVAFLKPAAEGVSTNIALVCESGRIYSFIVSEDSLTKGGTLGSEIIWRVSVPSNRPDGCGGEHSIR